ncbi:hypothetical protein ACYSNR_16090 [Enterococcus sp. LJL128]|uniref:hypothetical protein n=1 Tax=Enterococcus sp. LJL51 TaxID=3416656 RepID=UPI003CEC8DE5
MAVGALFFLILMVAALVLIGGILIVGLTGLITFVLSLFSIGAMATVKRKKKFGNGWYALPLIPLIISIIMVIPLLLSLAYFFIISR